MFDRAGLNGMATRYDSLTYARQLEAAGVPASQASIHAQALGDVLANVVVARQLAETEERLREDIQDAVGQSEQRLSTRVDQVHFELNAKIDQVRLELNAKIDQVRLELNAKIDQVRLELYARVDQVRLELGARIDTLDASLRREIRQLRWMLATIVAANVTMLIKLYMP